MVIEVTCECGRAIEAGEEDAARGSVACPACAKDVTVPRPVPAGAAAASAAARPVDPMAETSPDLSEVPSPDAATPPEIEAPIARRHTREEADRCPLCGRRFRAGDVICEGCGTNLETSEPPPVKRFSGRRYDSRYVIFGAMLVALVVTAFAVRSLVRSGADQRAVQTAREQLRAGNLKEAEEGFRRGIAYDDKNAAAWAGLAEVLIRTGHAQEAADAAETALRLDPRGAGAMARAILGRARLDQGRLEEALQLLQAASKEKPDLDSVRHWIAHALFGLKRSVEAIPAYEEAVAADPRSIETPLSHLRLGTLYLLKQRTAEAEGQLEKATRAGAPPAEVEAAYGDLYAQKSLSKQALDAYARSLAANPRQPAVYAKSARLRWRTGDRPGALRDIAEAKALENVSAEVFRLEGQIRAEMNDAVAAAAAFAEALRRNPKDVEARLALAKLEMDRGEPARARREIDAALEIAPDHVPALTALAELARAVKDFKAAAEALKRAVAAEPAEAGLRVKYAQALEEAGLHADAQIQYLEAVKADPTADAPRRRLAEIHVAGGRLKEAGQEYEELIKLRPKDLEYKMALAKVRDAERRWDAVIELTEAILKKDPSHKEAKNLQEKARYEKFREGG